MTRLCYNSCRLDEGVDNMQITVNLSKAELDLIEEALLYYHNLLMKSEKQDEMMSNDIILCRRVVEEFGMEEPESASPSHLMHTQPSYQAQLQAQMQSQHQLHPSQQQNQQNQQQNQYASPTHQGAGYPNQYPFSR